MVGTDGGKVIAGALARVVGTGRPALSAFLTAGFPHPRGFGDLLRSVGREADVVEVGVPFSDPVADGATIQRSSRAALRAGVTLSWILDEIAAARAEAPVVLMSYLNPLLAVGLEDLVRRASDAGVSGLIVPDLPFEECAPLVGACGARGLALVQLVAPVSDDGRLRRLCRASQGFVYAVTATGTTGGYTGFAHGCASYLRRVRRASSLPVLAGFGIRSRVQLESIAPFVDGVIVGSALVEVLERGDDPIRFLRDLREGVFHDATGGASR